MGIEFNKGGGLSRSFNHPACAYIDGPYFGIWHTGDQDTKTLKAARVPGAAVLESVARAANVPKSSIRKLERLSIPQTP